MKEKNNQPIINESENLELFACSECFYCVDINFEAETFYCSRINKTIGEFAYKSEVCEKFLDYWEAYKIVEKNND